MSEKYTEYINPETQQVVDWSAGYVFWSFYFSQADVKLQDNLDRFMVGRFPDKQADFVGHKQAVIETAYDRVARFVFNPSNHISANSITEKRVGNVVRSRVDHISHIDPLKKPVNTTSLVLDMVGVELRLLNPELLERSHPYRPRFGRSILLEYLVDGLEAKHEVFRRFFDEARQENLLSHQENRADLQQLEDWRAQLQGRVARQL